MVKANKDITLVTDSKVSCKEHNKSFILLNPERKNILRIRVDGGIFQKGKPPKRCDFILCDDLGDCKTAKSWYIFIELKGTRVPDGIQQLETTIKSSLDFEEIINLKKAKNKYAYLVTKNMPNTYNPKIQKAEIIFRKFYGVTLIVKNSIVEHPTHLHKEFKDGWNNL